MKRICTCDFCDNTYNPMHSTALAQEVYCCQECEEGAARLERWHYDEWQHLNPLLVLWAEDAVRAGCRGDLVF